MDDKTMAVLVALVLIPIGVISAIKPASWWWATSSWQYRKPEANEPSEAAYAWMRVSGIISALAGVLVIVLAATTD